MEDKQAAVIAAGLKSGEYVMLMEAVDDTVQPREIAEAFPSQMVETLVRARKIASVRQGALTRMQARRNQNIRSSTQVFDNLSDAEAWLFEA